MADRSDFVRWAEALDTIRGILNPRTPQDLVDAIKGISGAEDRRKHLEVENRNLKKVMADAAALLSGKRTAAKEVTDGITRDQLLLALKAKGVSCEAAGHASHILVHCTGGHHNVWVTSDGTITYQRNGGQKAIRNMSMEQLLSELNQVGFRHHEPY